MISKFFTNLFSGKKKGAQSSDMKEIEMQGGREKSTSLIDMAIKDLDSTVSTSANMTMGSHETYQAERERLHLTRCQDIDIDKYKNVSTDKIDIELNVGEILFLKYIDGWRASNRNFPLYWTYDHDLIFHDVLYKLSKHGYITFADIEFKLSCVTVNELKELLRTFNLKVSGRKQELIDRLLSSIPVETLNSTLGEDYFSITDKAKALIDRNEHIFYFNNNKGFGFDIYKIDKAYKNSSFENYYSLALSLLSDRLKENESERRYGLIRNDFYNISKVYSHMKDCKREFTYLLMCLSIDMFEGMLRYADHDCRAQQRIKRAKEEGLDSDFAQQYLGNTLDKEKYYSQYIFAPAIISRIAELQKILNLSNDNLNDFLWNSIEKLSVVVPVNDFNDRFDELVANLEGELHG